jgi:hypothetical protein
LLGDGPLNFDGGMTVPTPDGGTRACFVTQCQNHVYQCGDCMDNDGDGRIDADDPDCLGPCDNSEDSLSPKIPGGNNAPCKADCFFDQDTGSGNDQCYWDHACDPHEVAPNFDPEGPQCRYDPGTKVGGGLNCTTANQRQSDQCLSFCGPLTPNGCDCFGCCDIPDPKMPNKTHRVWLGSRDQSGVPSCSIADVADPKKCRPCQKVAACDKPCERCKLCIGKDTIPPDCFHGGGGGMDGGMGGGPDGGGGAPWTCSNGAPPCGLPGLSCPALWYCVTGCCVPPLG